MGCPESILLGKYLVFSIAVHDPETGALSAVDSLPAYKIYADEDNSLVVSGNMSILDESEVGFYTESLFCDTPDFADGEHYTLCIKATVDTISGGITYIFTAHEDIPITIGVPIVIHGFDAMAGKQVLITGRYS